MIGKKPRGVSELDILERIDRMQWLHEKGEPLPEFRVSVLLRAAANEIKLLHEERGTPPGRRTVPCRKCGRLYEVFEPAELTRIRKACGLTMEKMAAKEGIPLSTLSAVERGNYPTPPVVYRKYLALGLRMGVL